MIDEKKLIKKIEEEIARQKENMMLYNLEIKGLEYALRLVKMQPTVNEWIPCSERMPNEYDESKDVIDPITLEAETIHSTVSKLVNVTVIDLDKDESFVCDDCTVNGKWSNFKYERFEVVAWQPLPERYQFGDVNKMAD